MVGSNSFSDQAGELRAYFDGTNTIVEANVNGDASADFQILVNGRSRSAPSTSCSDQSH